MHSPNFGHGRQVVLTDDGLEPSVLHRAIRGDELDAYHAKAATVTTNSVPSTTTMFFFGLVCAGGVTVFDIDRGGIAVIGPIEILRVGVPSEGRPLNDFFSAGGLTDRAGGD